MVGQARTGLGVRRGSKLELVECARRRPLFFVLRHRATSNKYQRPCLVIVSPDAHQHPRHKSSNTPGSSTPTTSSRRTTSSPCTPCPTALTPVASRSTAKSRRQTTLTARPRRRRNARLVGLMPPHPTTTTYCASPSHRLRLAARSRQPSVFKLAHSALRTDHTQCVCLLYFPRAI